MYLSPRPVIPTAFEGTGVYDCNENVNIQITRCYDFQIAGVLKLVIVLFGSSFSSLVFWYMVVPRMLM